MTDPRRTPLFDLHESLGGRMVDFAGWELPIQYEGVVSEHNWCRSSAGLFDVGHMGVVELRGDDPAAAFEALNPAGLTTLKPGKIRYGLLTLDNGGVLDDLMTTNSGDYLTLVVNASRREIDLAHLRQGLAGIDVIERDDLSLLALQGPKAIDVMSRLIPAVTEMFFLEAIEAEIKGVPVTVSRSGYTGEDGFEITVPSVSVETLARLLLDAPEVKPMGLGARDTLRLEAGLCLYGHELTEEITPIEADLRWTIPKRRREAKDFPGAEIIMSQYDTGAKRLRVGLLTDGKRPVRDGSTLKTLDGEPVGEVSSGGYGPSVEAPVAMGYVASAHAAIGTKLIADVRGKDVPITVADLPFSPHTYVRRPR